MQSRTDSLMEALANIVVGFGVNLAANIIFLPLVLGIPIHIRELGLIGAIFTVISLVRSYTLRRLFNGRTIWQAVKDLFAKADDTVAPLLTKEEAVLERVHQARLRVQQLIERP